MEQLQHDPLLLLLLHVALFRIKTCLKKTKETTMLIWKSVTP